VIDSIRTNIRLFLEYAKANSNKQNIKFVVEWTQLSTTEDPTESSVISNLAPETTYRFKIQAITLAGDTAESDLITQEDEDESGLAVSQSKRQAKWISAYTLHCQPQGSVSYRLTVIDTPGFGDVGGLNDFG
ncbi:unnamed protein product, partial [Didymodactylos carnosus]